ncbi:MAG: large conductance mechanosensitive channel protein MscL [Bacilli bacterium]|nr:large conductance mechanosensitive channel protein MscL [Bacilli bacterium]
MSKKDPNKKGFFAEFKEFITRGNVIDMAVGVIIGGAFTAIVTALTSGILQPIINYLIGLIMGDASLEAARTILGNPVYTVNDLGEKVVDWAKTNYIDWGTFISAIINFLLVAIILFLIIKGINAVHQKGVEAKEKIEKSAKKEEAEEPKAE